MRTARRSLALTQRELASRSGLSWSTIKAYETGARHPSQSALTAIIDGLGITGDQAEVLLQSAGYSPRPPRERFFHPTARELVEEAERCTWPAFVTNQSFEVIGGNAQFARVFGVARGSERRSLTERNLLVGLSDESFASRLENWDEVARFMLGLAKGDPRFAASDDRILPWLESSVQRFFGGDATRIRGFLETWESAPPIAHRLRHRYRIHWRSFEGPLLRFDGIMAVADLGTELGWNEWLPADEVTWSWLRLADAETP